MKKSNKKVEQINLDGNVVIDYGEILSPKKIEETIIKLFPDTKKEQNNLYFKYNNKKYGIYCKNISYLGNPHPIFKKRIQIPREFKNVYLENKKNGIETIIIGVYKYNDNILFCDFDISKYIGNKLHNSSAHVMTLDLKKANTYGYFKKKDFKGNEITTFDISNIEFFIKNKFESESSTSRIEIVNTFDEFFNSITKSWFGKQCYDEMLGAGFSKAMEGEWGGFYLEYLFSNYIFDNKLEEIVKYQQNKKKNDIDLDLYFPKFHSFGDLKSHSMSSSGILGNDLRTIKKLIDNNDSVYYIVCNHDTEMDKEHDYVVTKHWNKLLRKDNELSYGNKMKYRVELKEYYILEINKDNFNYITIYNQGKNSNGKERNPKISINSKHIDNFLIHVTNF